MPEAIGLGINSGMNLKMLLSECQWAWMISAPSAPKALYNEHPSATHTVPFQQGQSNSVSQTFSKKLSMVPLGSSTSYFVVSHQSLRPSS